MKQIIPYVLNTYTGLTGLMNFADTWIGRAKKNLIGVMFDITIPITNTDAMAPHDFLGLVALQQIEIDLRTKYLGYLGQGVSGLFLTAASCMTGFQESDAALDVDETTKTIGAGLTVPVDFQILWPLTDQNLNDGLDGVIPSRAMKDYRFRCADIMAGQDANLAIDAAGWQIRVIAGECIGQERHGTPLLFKDGVLNDALERFYDSHVSHLFIHGPAAAIAADDGSPYTVRLDGEPVIENTAAFDVHQFLQAGVDPDYRIKPDNVLQLLAPGFSYQARDILDTNVITLEKRDGEYTAGVRYGLIMHSEQTRESVTDASQAASSAGLALVAVGQGGKKTLMTGIPKTARRRVPLTFIPVEKLPDLK